jgi:cytoskeletal protein CcmA (bactofilin family)
MTAQPTWACAANYVTEGIASAAESTIVCIIRRELMSDPSDTAGERMSIIPPSLKFRGELSADEDLLILGQIEGTIKHTQRLTVGKAGKVKANISAQVIKVEGTVWGDLHAERSVSVEGSGNLRGSIHAPSVCLVEGSRFNGVVDMDVKKSSPADKPEARGKTGA